MSVNVGDVLPLLRDYSRNQNLSDARGMRAIESALSFLQAHLGLPGHEREYKFNFFQDDITFAIPVDYGEPISLRFDEERLNHCGRFTYKPAELLFQRVKEVDFDTKLWGKYDADEEPLLYVLAKNSFSVLPIDNFDVDNSTNWVATLDATAIVTDSITYKEGVASLRFNLDTSISGLNRGTITRTLGQGQDLTIYNDVGYGKFYLYIPTASLALSASTSVSLTWGTDASNYWKNTVTTQQDGEAFEYGWNELGVPWYGSTIVGAPTVTNVPYYSFDLDYAAGTADTDSIRLDYLRFEVPDEMITTYYTTYVGQNAGGTYLTTLTATTDVFLFGDRDPSLKQLVAAMAAVILNPQILVDDAYVRKIYNDFSTLYARKYPKKRTNNLLAEPQTSRTSHPKWQ